MTYDPEDGLRFGRLGPGTVHLCIDMQNLFAEATPWHTPSMKTILPQVLALVRAHPAETIFTRFVPARRPEEASGAWQRYYERWREVTLERLAPGLVDLMPPLVALVPPAEIVDKTTYGPWQDDALACRLAARGADTLVVSGGETDVCVLAAVLGAVDLGLRVVLASDALCSSSPAMQEAMMMLYRSRYDVQVETATSAQILEAWR